MILTQACTCLEQAIDEMQAVGVTTVPARTSGPQRKSRLRNRSATATAGDTGTSAGSQGSAAAGTRLAGGSTTSNRSSRSHQDQISEQDLEGVDRRAICEDILTGGHVQTFVDFFYLTHRPAPAQGRTAVKRDTWYCRCAFYCNTYRLRSAIGVDVSWRRVVQY